jgi:hypothetical protein
VPLCATYIIPFYRWEKSSSSRVVKELAYGHPAGKWQSHYWCIQVRVSYSSPTPLCSDVLSVTVGDSGFPERPWTSPGLHPVQPPFMEHLLWILGLGINVAHFPDEKIKIRQHEMPCVLILHAWQSMMCSKCLLESMTGVNEWTGWFLGFPPSPAGGCEAAVYWLQVGWGGCRQVQCKFYFTASI